MSLLSGFFSTKTDAAAGTVARREGIDLGRYLRTTQIPIVEEPFRHIVVDDFFVPEVYAALLAHFNAVMARGMTQEGDPRRFHPFLTLTGKFAYDGYLYIPHFREPGGPAFLYSFTWKDFFSSLFGHKTVDCTVVAYHHHPVGDKTGFVHNDFTLKQFAPEDVTGQGMIWRDREGAQQVPVFTKKRSIAILYYLGNDAWKEGDGGETGLYLPGATEPVVKIAPKNNRLFAFEISPRSFHAFQRNKTSRDSIIQWLHVDDVWANARYGA